MRFKKEDEEVISKEIGYPYNVIPKGYPNKISNKKINETINSVLENLKGNAGVESIVSRDTAFINLGLNELTNRQNKKQSTIAFLVSIISIILAISALVISILVFKSSKEDKIIQDKQLDEIKNIRQVITEKQN